MPVYVVAPCAMPDPNSQVGAMAWSEFGQDCQEISGGDSDKVLMKLRFSPTSLVNLTSVCEKLSNGNAALQQLDHPGLLPSFFLCSRTFLGGAPAVVSPWLEQGNIHGYLERNPSADRFSKILTVANTLRYLHSNGVVHGDLKPSNILIDGCGSPVLSDFGLSHIIDPCNSEDGLGSVRYAAPELMDGTVKNRTYESDVYAFASVSVEILTGIKPFANTNSDVDVVLSLYHRDLPYSPPEHPLLGNSGLDQTLWDMMTACWNREPVGRPDMTQVCNTLGKISAILRGEKNPGLYRSHM